MEGARIGCMGAPEDLVRTGIAQALAITDRVERAREITKVVGVIQDTATELRRARQSDVLHLRATPLTLREVGELLGMSTGRVDQIAKGK